MKQLIVICGPTASGKTRMGIVLAKALGGEIVSADSMQVYRGMDIGTAKPSLAEREGIPHHMLDVAEPEEHYSAARYVEEATACVEDIFSRGKRPIVVGGTGLYIDALCRGARFAAGPPERAQRERLRGELREAGAAAMHAQLMQIDPETAQRLHVNDEKRILRALEVFYETGKTLSQHNRESQSRPPRYQSLTIGLSCRSRAALYRRIDLRVEQMMEQGLLLELEALQARGLPPDSTAMQAIGYKELAAALARGETREQAVAEIQLRSRQYAKRQLSWFRRNSRTHWVLWGETPDFSFALQDSMRFLAAEGLK